MEGVYVVNPEELKEKLKRFKPDNFHIISDFDGTLTKGFDDGRKYVSSYTVIREGGYLSPEYVKKSFALVDHYRPIEYDPGIPLEEKEKAMVEWWSKHYDLMIKYGINKGVIKDILNKEVIKFREGISEFFNLLERSGIPVLIFSSGLGNLVQEFMESKGRVTSKVHIISNFFVFDKNGKAISYTRPLIHVLGKKEVQIEKFSYHKEISDRKNVILLGDVVGDLGMTEGVEHDNVIKIGFLNARTDELLEDYKKNFDVVIINDGPMDYVNELLKEILE